MRQAKCWPTGKFFRKNLRLYITIYVKGRSKQIETSSKVQTESEKCLPMFLVYWLIGKHRVLLNLEILTGSCSLSSNNTRAKKRGDQSLKWLCILWAASGNPVHCYMITPLSHYKRVSPEEEEAGGNTLHLEPVPPCRAFLKKDQLPLSLVKHSSILAWYNG